VSLSTVERTWTFARAWLFRRLQSEKTRPRNSFNRVKGMEAQ
jgi:hypothetical protein